MKKKNRIVVHFVAIRKYFRFGIRFLSASKTKHTSEFAMNYNFHYVDRDKLQQIINKVQDKRNMLTPLMDDFNSKIIEELLRSTSTSDDDENDDEYYENERVESDQVLTSDAMVAPQMMTYRKNIGSTMSIDSIKLSTEPNSNRIETKKQSAEDEKPKPNQSASDSHYYELIHNIQEEIARNIDQLIIKITEKKYLLNQKSAFGTNAKQICKHTKSFSEDYLNRIQEIYKQLSARESTMQIFELKTFAQCHQSILKGLNAFERYFTNAFNNSSIDSFSTLLIYAEKMTTKFMKRTATEADPKYFEMTSILSRKLLRVIDIIDDLQKRSCEQNIKIRKKSQSKQSRKSLDVYGGGGKVAVKRKLIKKMSVDVSKTKVTRSKQKPGSQKNGLKRELVTISEEKTVRIAMAQNVSSNGKQDEWRKSSLLLIEELNEVANKCSENVSETNDFINKNQLIESLRYFAKKFCGQPIDNATDFPSILSSSSSCSQTELQPPQTHVEECNEKPASPAPINENDANLQSKSMTCEEIFRPTKNVQLLYLRSNSDTLEQCSESDDANRNQTRSIISLDEMIEQRNKFVASLKKKSMYKNKHFGRPWKVLSRISDNIMNEIIDSILSQL